ncbi:MAG: SPFH domain-containing protein [Planctomycetota bacterium]
MAVKKYDFSDAESSNPSRWLGAAGMMAVILVIVSALFGWMVYRSFRVEVPAKHVAILTKKTGLDLPNDVELAPSEEYKGIQLEIMREGRAFYNPYEWEWEILPQVEVPEGKVGVRVRLFGDDLPHQQLLAYKPNEKGIVPGVLGPGRYPEYSNRYAYEVRLFEPVTIPAGYKGVITLVTGHPAKDSNQLLVEPGERGVQKTAYDPGTYYVNPYEVRISQVDCRTKKLDLSDELDLGFPSKDGFWIRLGGAVQFHVDPERAPEVFVTYNIDRNGDDIYDEIVDSVILPNARSFCRIAGSSYTGRQFIEGTEREGFQKSFQTKLSEECGPLGVVIDSALITKIYPPEPIAEPVRMREIAKQKQSQFKQEMLQQQSEAKLVIEKKKIDQKTRLIDAQREVIKMETKAMEEQKVAVTKAEQELSVAKTALEAAKDQAQAILARGKAESQVIRLNNEAEVSGLRASVEAFAGNGFLFAQQVLLQRLAPSYKQIMANTSDSPIMKVFEQFQSNGPVTNTRKPSVSAETGSVDNGPSPTSDSKSDESKSGVEVNTAANQGDNP